MVSSTTYNWLIMTYGRKSDEKNCKFKNSDCIPIAGEHTQKMGGGGGGWGSPCENDSLIWALGSTSEVQVELLWAATM